MNKTDVHARLMSVSPADERARVRLMALLEILDALDDPNPDIQTAIDVVVDEWERRRLFREGAGQS